MKKGIHRGLGLLLAIVVVAMLAACSTKDSVSEVPDKDDSDAIVPPASVLPFADVVDLSEYFVDEPVEFSESTPKGELVCVNIDESQYSKADDTILLPNEKQRQWPFIALGPLLPEQSILDLSMRCLKRCIPYLPLVVLLQERSI
ncbi:MAG: hypothetical protein ACLRX4_11420 [Oscillospiraceae bacterium]